MRPRNTKNLKTTLSWIRLTNRSQRKARKRYRKNNALYTLIYNVLQGYQTSTVSFFTWIPLLWGSSRVTFFFRNAVSFRLKTITVPRLNHRRSAASRTLSLASSSIIALFVLRRMWPRGDRPKALRLQQPQKALELRRTSS